MVASSSSGPLPRRLVAVDALRALAALAVLFHHVSFSADDLPSAVGALLSVPTRLGRLGVPLFLVLSGFCIHLGVARALSRGEGMRPRWVAFWQRRFWRLYPPYLAAIGVSLLVYFGLAGAAAYPNFERVCSLPADLLAHLLMVHNLFADYCFGLGNGPFWTLGLEEQLYALYALFLLVRRRRSAWWIAGIGLTLSLVWQCTWKCCCGMDEGAMQPTLGPAAAALGRWLKWPIGLWFYWILGAVAAEGYAGAIQLPAWCTSRRLALALVACGLGTSHVALSQFFPHAERTSGPGLLSDTIVRIFSGFSEPAVAAAAFILLNCSIKAEAAGGLTGLFARILSAIGVMSYSLYLTHLPLVRLLEHWLPPGTTLAHWLMRLAVVFPVCLGFAALFFHLVERHFLGQPSIGSRPPTLRAETSPPRHIALERHASAEIAERPEPADEQLQEVAPA